MWGALETIERCRLMLVLEWKERLALAHGIALEELRTAIQGRGYRFELLHAE